MRTLLRAALAASLAFASIVGPTSAATTQAITVAQATSSTGTLSGVVVDSNGQKVGGATVTVQGGGNRQTTTTDSQGSYSFALPPALYTVTVEKGGYQEGQQDIAVSAGASVTSNVTLSVVSFSTLNVIGRTSTTASANTATFNTSSNPTYNLGQQTIRDRNTPDLNQIVQTIPGVTITNSATNVNHQFVIHGLATETRITLDGHPVSTGTSGQFITNFAGAGLFQNVDTYQGPVIGPTAAGTSGAGIVNLRTPDYANKTGGYVLGGYDQYGGSQYTLIFDGNFLNNKLQLVLGDSFYGYNGPSKNTYANDIDTNSSDVAYNFPNQPATLLTPGAGTYPITGNYTVPTLGTGTSPAYPIASYNDFSNTYSLSSQVAKLRFNFTDTTSLAFEFLGLQGTYEPQGNAYGQLAGYETIPQCVNQVLNAKGAITNTTPGYGAQCTPASIYNAPWTANQIGSTQALYQYYPGSTVKQNEPNFNLDFTTAIGDNTLLFRPYTANINRFIDGSGEADIPGQNGAWYEVTNTANCVIPSTFPTAAGASGPCFSANAAANYTPYVTGVPSTNFFGTLFPYQTTNLPNGGAGCSVSLPCYTTSTKQAQSGAYGYGTPYSTFEFDKLNGYTGSFIHPFGDGNTASLNVDHYLDYTFGEFNDTSTPPAGCTYVQPTGVANTIAKAGPAGPGYGYQSTCPLATLPYSPISTPATVTSVTSISGTLQYKIIPSLEFDFGGYYNITTILGQVQNQALVATAVGAGAAAGSVQVQLVPSNSFFNHFDPHFGFVWRPIRSIAVRALGGSSQTLPYANQLSGFTKVNQGASGTTLTSPNPLLVPEELVSYDLGLDYRTKHGSVFSGDAWAITVHNPFITQTNPVPPGSPTALAFAGENTGLLQQSATFNGPQEYSQGFQFAYKDEPKAGWGYYLSGTMQRVYYLDLPASYYAGTSAQYPFNGWQLAGTPYARGYGEFRYAWANGSLVRMGVDYEGNNNSNNYSPYALWDLTLRQNVGYGIMLSVTGSNIFNTNFGNGIARSVEYQGNQTNGAYLPAGTPTNANLNAPFVYAIHNAQLGIVGPPPQTFTFTLSKQF